MRQNFWANLHGSGWTARHRTAQAQHRKPMLACCPCSTNSEMGLSGSTIQENWFLRLVKFIFFFVGPLGGILWGSHLTEFFNFWEQTQLIEIYPKMKISRIYRRFSQLPTFLTTFFPKVQISKFCLYKSMNWVQASVLKGFLQGLGTCHTFHNWVTKFSVFACPQLYKSNVQGLAACSATVPVQSF